MNKATASDWEEHSTAGGATDMWVKDLGEGWYGAVVESWKGTFHGYLSKSQEADDLEHPVATEDSLEDAQQAVEEALRSF
jgi:hypothetical protein